MGTSTSATYEDHARKAIEDDPHFVATVARMGDARRVVTAEVIFSAAGAKLVDKDVAVGSALREHLLRYKLMKPIEQSLSVADGVTAESLAAHAAGLLETQPYLRRLFPFPADRRAAQDALAQVELSSELAFKLTVAREQRPPLFDHLLTVTLICRYVSLHLGLSVPDNADLLLAALLHDLGELHTDPAVLDQRRRLGPDEMRYIYAHPITGYLIAKAVAAGHPEAATAVLQHQERLDGSGYPYGLRADATSRLARIVAIADVCASILARFGNNSRLSTLMRLNHRKYEPALIALLQKAWGSPGEDDAADDMPLVPQLKAVAKLLKHWSEFRASVAGIGGNSPPAELGFLFERMVNLHVVLLQFGFDPNSLQVLRALIAEDRDIAGELAAALDEVRWQFADLEREILRRQDAAEKALSAEKFMFFGDWLADLRQYLEETPAG